MKKFIAILMIVFASAMFSGEKGKIEVKIDGMTCPFSVDSGRKVVLVQVQVPRTIVG